MALDLAERIRSDRLSSYLAHSSPSAGITQLRFMRSALRALSAHTPPRTRRLRLEFAGTPFVREASSRYSEMLLSLSPGRGEEVGEDAVRIRVQREPYVAALDLDRVDVVSQARLPVDDPVRARVDRGRRHLWCGGKVAQEARLDRCRMAVAGHVVEVCRSHAGHGQRMDVEGILEPRPEWDHLLDEIPVPVR